MTDQIAVLDHGYVRLVDVLGTDLSVVNAARSSFAKESQTFEDRDARLLRYLARHGHLSPFRHVMLTFEMYAPLMVARQVWRYAVGSDHTMDAWNESSRRYVTTATEFYTPTVWRSAPESKKQGSGAAVGDGQAAHWHDMLAAHQLTGAMLYEQALADGLAAEQARLFLAAYGLYVSWRWTCSLQSALWFVQQRSAEDAQSEIQPYAAAVSALTAERFPASVAALLEVAS